MKTILRKILRINLEAVLFLLNWNPRCRRQHLNNDYFGYVRTVGFTAIKPKGQIQMIDAMLGYRQGEIHSAEMSTAYKVGFKDSVTLMIEVQI